MVCMWRYCVACRKDKNVRAGVCLHSAKYSGYMTLVISIDVVIGVDVANIVENVIVYFSVMRCDVADAQCSDLCGELSFVHSYYFFLPFPDFCLCTSFIISDR